jgi:hypothetical protein
MRLAQGAAHFERNMNLRYAVVINETRTDILL